MIVVSGVLVHGSGHHVLMGKRKQGKPRPGLWELPGGKVEPSETHETALVREWREELGLPVEVGALVAYAVFELETVVMVSLYEVRETVTGWAYVPLPKAPEPIDHDELRWVKAYDAVIDMPCSPGFYAHYGALRRYITSRNTVR